MRNTVALHQTMLAQQSTDGMSILIGQLIARDNDGRPLVKFPGCNGPCVARLMQDVLNPAEINPIDLPMMVLIAVPAADDDSPVILGRISDTLPQPSKKHEIDLPRGDKRHVSIDGEQVMLEAKKEMVLSCGKSSITLKKNGKVIIKGVDLINRAARTNKIKGASVNIN